MSEEPYHEPARDPGLAYSRALTAYGAMADELRAAFGDVLAALPGTEESRMRLDRALAGFWAALGLLDQTQYQRIEALVISDQAAIARLVDTLESQLKEVVAQVAAIEYAAKLRDKKLDMIIDLLQPIAHGSRALTDQAKEVG